ncbi:TonB-dependent receptor [Bacteroides sp. 51]|uniref:SusC/RagA family TonB-linked outer membrane protein n=1 Tax=Bacteroides sp. 51 TaxID=2302938 RepID=UPI0013D5AE15|nr:TonB-dependent receptor [Bacteroides sp. 51]NDV84317.1 TonB-dependent receptor [Bacteroides sp. 51]
MNIQLSGKLKRSFLFLENATPLLRLFVILLLYVGGLQAVQAQGNRTITGKVLDESGETIIGANVATPNKSVGTITDIDGNFSISIPANATTLVVSYIGYRAENVKVGTQNRIEITLKEDAQKLEEVIVVGYGAQKKATLTGAVAAVTNKEIVSTKSTNIQNMLTGKLPGVRNIQKTSEPGQFTNQFDIRGLGSPLLVVDGVPRGDMPRMDPNDVESISVLKDASAAIYGVRAANGVVLITTKKGEQGKAKIEYSGYYGIQTPAEILRPLGSWDRALLANELKMRSTTDPQKEYNQEYFDKLAKGEMPDTDWYDAVLKNTAPQQQHNVSISGGAGKVDYYVNFGYTDQGSFFRTNSANYNRYNLRTNLNAQMTKHLKAGVKLNMIMDETNRQNQSTWEVFKMLWRSRPTDPVYANNTAPYFYRPDVEYNVAAVTHPEMSGYVKNQKNMFQSNMYVEYDVPYVKGLTAKAMYSYDRTWDDNSTFRKEYNEYRHNAVTDQYEIASTRNSKTELKREFKTSYSTLWNVQLNYDNTFAEKHHVGALLLYEEAYNQGYDFNAKRYFEIPIPYLFAGNSENQEGTGSGLNENASRGLVGRLNYDYAGKYIGEFSFRYDGSSKFPKGKQWGFFPSVLLAYRISEESFIKDNLPFVQNLKIRGSWGKLGDDNASRFQFVEGYDYPQDYHNRVNLPRGSVFGTTFVNALGTRSVPNMDITWYTAKMLNLGIDVDLWHGLFGFSVDFFKRDRDGLLDKPSVVVPATFGSAISEANLNADRTKGFEIELRHNHRIQDFRYNVTGTVQMTRSMWTKKVMPPYSNSYDNWRNNYIDRWNDIWFGKGKNGHFTSYDHIANSIYGNANSLPGDPIYEDWNGDGIIDDQDKHPIAITTNSEAGAGLPGTDLNKARNYPLMNFSLSLGGQWKCIDVSLLFQGAAMSYIGYGEQLLNPLTWDGNALDLLFDRWHPADPDKDPYDPTNKWISGYYPYGKMRAEETSKFNIQSGAYVRLKSAEIGVTIPKNSFFEKAGIKNMRLYVNGYNLLTITGVKGLDPEKPSESYGYLYPLSRTYNFGGSITF